MFPHCSFCGERPVAAWFEGPDFVAFIDAAEDVRAEEAWLACSTCFSLVQKGDRDRLVQRGMRRLRADGSRSRGNSGVVRMSHERFWAARSP